MPNTNWIEKEVQRHSQKISDLEELSNETTINVVKLIEQQKIMGSSIAELDNKIMPLEQAEIRRDERSKLWKWFLGFFVVGVFIGAIINDIHIVKVILGH